MRVYPRRRRRASRSSATSTCVGGQTAANLVTVAVGAGGRVRLRNSLGSLHLIADLAGYYAPGAPGRFVPVVADPLPRHPRPASVRP